MKKSYRLLALLMFLSVLILVGCTEEEKTKITGISFEDASFVYDGTAKSIYIKGELPEGVTVSYEGNGKTEVGSYTVKATFSVTEEYEALAELEATLTITARPVITLTGVTDGGIYDEDVTPVFSQGTATLKKGNAEPVSFESGTVVSGIGSYVLTITNDFETMTVSFTINERYEVYEGEITDYFENLLPHKDYIQDSNSIYALADGKLVFTNKPNGDPWGILKRKFEGVNATENPYLEISVDKVYPGAAVRLEVALMTEEWSTEPTLLTIQYAGVYYVDVLSYVRAKGLSETDAEIYLKLAVVGQSAGYAGVEINYYKSVSEIPAKIKAEAYIDETVETLSLWRANTATLEIIEDKAYGFVTNSTEPYGNFVKRVELNTIDYQDLIVDIDEVLGSASWALKYQIGNGPEKTLVETNNSGIFHIDLSKYPDLSNQENITVMLYFYVIGNGDDDFVVINGLRTEYLEPIADPTIIDDLKLDSWQVALGTKVFEEGSLTVTKAASDAMAKFSKTLIINTVENRYVAFYITTSFQLDPGFSILVIDQTKDGWPLYKYQGAEHALETVDNGDGTYSYVYVLDLSLKEVFMNQESTSLFFEVVVEFGDTDKTIELTKVGYYEVIEEDLTMIDDMSNDTWNVALGTKVFEKGSLKVTKVGSEQMAKFSKTLTLNTILNRYVAFYITTSFQLDPGFSIQVIDQGKPGWPLFKYQGAEHALESVDNGDGTYSYIYVLDLSKQEVFMNQESTALFFEVVIEFGDTDKTVELTKVTYYEIIEEDFTMIDDMSTDTWNVALGTKVFEEGSLKVTKVGSESMAKFSKSLVVNTVANRYVAFYITTSFQLDAGFSITVIDQGKPGWPMHKYQGAEHALNSIDNGDGTYTHIFVLDLSLQEVFMNQESTSLFFEIVLEFGDTDKTVELNKVTYYEVVEEDLSIIDDMSTDTWNVALGTKVFEEGILKVTKVGSEMAKFAKTFTLNTVENRYVAFHITTTFQLDAGFSIQVIDQGKPGWPMYKYQGAEHADESIDNGDGTYSYVYVLDLSLQEVFMNQRSTTLFFEVVVEYGDNDKTIELTQVSYYEIIE